MNVQSGYKKQQNLSFIQLLSELPAFIVTLISAIFANTMLLFVDLMDSLGNLIRTAMVTLLSKKLSKDLRYEYNYGVEKIEAIVSMFCNGIVFFGLLVTLGLSIYTIVFPDTPSDSIIAAAGIKVINVCFDTSFFVSQRKILKTHRSVISEANYAAALAALLFDSVTLVSLLAIWLLRNNPVGLYISPIISIFIALYLIVKCLKRTKIALGDLTDKTLPEEQQMKILSVLTKHYDAYSYFHSINSHKTGNITRVDIHLSFENDTSFEDILNLKNQMQDELSLQLGECIVNIIAENG
jgi:divalent metal cation (Fe/Co/Zn/Cd) transporter